MTHLPQILIVELGRTTGMFLAWFRHSKFSGYSQNHDLRQSSGNNAGF